MTTRAHGKSEVDTTRHPHLMDADLRARMIAEAAYYKAESRGFSGDCAMDDWLLAEAEIDGCAPKMSGDGAMKSSSLSN